MCDHNNCQDGSCDPLLFLNKAFEKYVRVDESGVKKKSRSCQETDCETRASYGNKGEKAGYCKRHAKEGMVDVVNKRCRCGKSLPTFNEPGEKTAACCKKCKTKTMIDIINRKCKCGKAQPIYNEPEEKKAICCKECKTDTMIDIKNVKCRCGKAQPIYNDPGEKKAICCKECKTDNMINIKDKSCRCGRVRPIYNEPGQKNAICCKECKTDTMINIKDKKCRCGRVRPNYNEPGETTAICCKECKTKTMINVKKGKQCKCGKARPNYNEPGETIPICCSICKSDTMIDIMHDMCKGYLCTIRSNQKYEEYCYRCFINMFPDSPIVKNHKTKERAVADYIREQFPEYTILLDKRIQYGCSLRKPDILIDFGEYILIIEIDENQHRSYDCSCENKRLMELFKDAGSRPMVMIRFNPDRYYDKDSKSISSCWGYTKDKGLCVVKKKKEWQERLKSLEDTIELLVYYKGERKEVDVVHLFYDENLK